jgi:hypothetical protein
LKIVPLGIIFLHASVNRLIDPVFFSQVWQSTYTTKEKRTTQLDYYLILYNTRKSTSWKRVKKRRPEKSIESLPVPQVANQSIKSQWNAYTTTGYY